MSETHVIIENRTVCGISVPMQSFDGGKSWFRCDYTPIATNVAAPQPERAMKTPIRGSVGHRQRVVGKRGFVKTGKAPEGESLRKYYSRIDRTRGSHPNGKGVPALTGPLFSMANEDQLLACKWLCTRCTITMRVTSDGCHVECPACKHAVKL